jgi:hypothetical protein
MIITLERWEHAANRGDGEKVFSYCIAALHYVFPCMIYIMLLLPTEGDGQGDC